MKRMIFSGLIASLSFSQFVFAEHTVSPVQTGTFFNTVQSSRLTFNITSNIPNRTYSTAGIQILTPGYTIKGTSSPAGNGFYLFSVSDLASKTISMSGPSGNLIFRLCLSGIGNTSSCENHQFTIAKQQIIFVTSSTYSGDLGGVNAADRTCQNKADQSGNPVLIGQTYKALLVTSTRYPCSSHDGGFSGSCGAGYANDWPLSPGDAYFDSDGTTFFNTVNQNGVFDGSNSTILDETGASAIGDIWVGIQSVLTNNTTPATDITGWAYSDMNSFNDGNEYTANLYNCTDFTSSSGNGAVGNLKAIAFVSGNMPANTWGNYYYFDNSEDPYLGNVFSAGQYDSCGSAANRIVCVSTHQ